MDEFRDQDCGCKHIKGINCSVSGCYYNDCSQHCTANEIAVGPHNADCSSETLCVTFKPKED